MQSIVRAQPSGSEETAEFGFPAGSSCSLGRDFLSRHAAAKIVGYHYGDENTAAPGSSYRFRALPLAQA